MEQEENGNAERDTNEDEQSDANGNTERDESETEEVIDSSSNTSIEMEKSETGRRTSIFKFYEYKNVSSTGESEHLLFIF